MRQKPHLINTHTISMAEMEKPVIADDKRIALHAKSRGPPWEDC